MKPVARRLRMVVLIFLFVGLSVPIGVWMAQRSAEVPSIGWSPLYSSRAESALSPQKPTEVAAAQFITLACSPLTVSGATCDLTCLTCPPTSEETCHGTLCTAAQMPTCQETCSGPTCQETSTCQVASCCIICFGSTSEATCAHTCAEPPAFCLEGRFFTEDCRPTASGYTCPAADCKLVVTAEDTCGLCPLRTGQGKWCTLAQCPNTTQGLLCGLQTGWDFGNAPATYPVLLKDNGARHKLPSGVRLGEVVLPEPDGTPNTLPIDNDADASSTGGGLYLAVGTSVVCLKATAGGYLDAWVDFDGDGTWSSPGDRVASSVKVGSNACVAFEVPASTVLGITWARFRISTTGGLEPYGEASDGEVEDWPVVICASRPNEISDLFASQGNYWDHVQLWWSPVDGATSYDITRIHANLTGDPAQDEERRTVSGWTTHDYADYDVRPGWLYNYYVSARSACGTASYFAYAPGWAECQSPLDAPTGLAASEGTYPGAVQLTWNAVPGARAYLVYSSMGAGPEEGWRWRNHPRHVVPAPTTSYLDTDVMMDFKYEYVVEAIGTCDVGLALSDVAVGWPAKLAPKP